MKCHEMTNDGKPQKLLDLSDTVSSLQKQTKKNPGKHAVVCQFHNMLSLSYWFCCLSAKTKRKRSDLEWIGCIILAGCIVKCHFVGIIIFHCQRIVLLWWRICLNGNLACSSLKYGFCDASGKLLISFQGSYITLPGSLTFSWLF